MLHMVPEGAEIGYRLLEIRRCITSWFTKVTGS